ncbi:MAG: efflux RND transporter periplasmic adaptor subunit [Armatimonadota bacterium]
MKKVGTTILVIAILVGVPVAGFFIVKSVQTTNSAQATEAETATTVQVAAVQRGDITRSITLTGTVEADHVSGVVPKTPGKILRVHVDEGESVAKGDLLVELERKDLQAQLRQAKAAVGSAEARLRQAQSGTTLQEAETSTSIETARADLQAAKARLEQARTGADVTRAETGTSVEQASEQLRQAREQLAMLEAGSREQEKEQAKETVRQARASMENAKSNLQRAEKLLAQGAMAQQQYDAAKLQYDVAVAEYNSATQQLDLVQEGPRTQELEQARSRVAQAQSQLQLAQANQQQNRIRQQEIQAAQEQVRTAEAALKMARASSVRDTISKDDVEAARSALEQARSNVEYLTTQIGYTDIRAPIAGVVTEVEADPGEAASTAAPVVTITDNSTVFVRGSLPETQLRNVRVGQSVPVTVDALDEPHFMGEISQVIPSANPETRTFNIRVRVDNPEGRLHHGMYAELEIISEQVTNAIVVPRRAVVTRQGKDIVYLAANGRAKQREVTTGIHDETHVVITDGLDESDSLIVSGQTVVHPDAMINVVDESGDGE